MGSALHRKVEVHRRSCVGAHSFETRTTHNRHENRAAPKHGESAFQAEHNTGRSRKLRSHHAEARSGVAKQVQPPSWSPVTPSPSIGRAIKGSAPLAAPDVKTLSVRFHLLSQLAPGRKQAPTKSPKQHCASTTPRQHAPAATPRHPPSPHPDSSHSISRAAPPG